MDITSLKNLKPLDVFGLKNFRIFDDKDGFLEELSAINILTGANNSGKSSIVKGLQMLRNSIREYKYPFNLDLNQQEHLLGDFDNILFNKENRNIEIRLPYLFMGMKNFSISLTFESSSINSAYDARLRGLDIIDKNDKKILFSFQYRQATKDEKVADKANYDQNQEEYKKKRQENSDKEVTIFNSGEYYNPEPFENRLEGFIYWRINLEKLKHYLSEIIEVYTHYLSDKKRWARNDFKELNEILKEFISYRLPLSDPSRMMQTQKYGKILSKIKWLISSKYKEKKRWETLILS